MYTEFVNRNIPRVLTQIDRDPDSKTYGSCDRNYWHLKIRDFSSAILQQSCLTLALLYKTDYENNIYYKNKNVREWSLAALRYMGKIQLKDGSFNEYYPNEHGFPPTAFNLYAGCRTYIELELNDREILKFLGKAAHWLCRHSETNAYNQEWAAIAGMYLYYSISKDKTVLETVAKRVNHILSVQDKEGWFPEQGGADIGYSSVALDMMAEYYYFSKDEKVYKPILKLVNFLSFFVHPDGTIGGEYGSRNTIYFMPNGLETLISQNKDKGNIAVAMANKIYGYTDLRKNDFMDAVDERYLAHYVMHSYLRAISKYTCRDLSNTDLKLPCNNPHIKEFRNARLVTLNNGIYYCVLGLNKGGIIKIYKEDKEIYWDCGYRIPVTEGVTAATNWLDPKYKVGFKNNSYIIKGNFNKVAQKVQNPIYHFGLRVCAFLFGDKVNKLIKKLTIFQDNHLNAGFERKIKIQSDKIIIEDYINNINCNNVKEAPNSSLRLVASGKFFSISDLLEHEIRDYGKNRKIEIIKTVDAGVGKVNIDIRQV